MDPACEKNRHRWKEGKPSENLGMGVQHRDCQRDGCTARESRWRHDATKPWTDWTRVRN